MFWKRKQRWIWTSFYNHQCHSLLTSNEHAHLRCYISFVCSGGVKCIYLLGNIFIVMEDVYMMIWEQMKKKKKNIVRLYWLCVSVFSLIYAVCEGHLNFHWDCWYLHSGFCSVIYIDLSHTCNSFLHQGVFNYCYKHCRNNANHINTISPSISWKRKMHKMHSKLKRSYMFCTHVLVKLLGYQKYISEIDFAFVQLCISLKLALSQWSWSNLWSTECLWCSIRMFVR